MNGNFESDRNNDDNKWVKVLLTHQIFPTLQTLDDDEGTVHLLKV